METREQYLGEIYEFTFGYYSPFQNRDVSRHLIYRSGLGSKDKFGVISLWKAVNAITMWGIHKMTWGRRV